MQGKEYTRRNLGPDPHILQACQGAVRTPELIDDERRLSGLSRWQKSCTTHFYQRAALRAVPADQQMARAQSEEKEVG